MADPENKDNTEEKPKETPEQEAESERLRKMAEELNNQGKTAEPKEEEKPKYNFDFKSKDFYERLGILKNATKEEKRRMKTVFYSFIEEQTIKNEVALGDEVGIWDVERKPIDTIVIHHTANPPGMTPTYLSALELLRLYLPTYAQNQTPEDVIQFNKPISSGHIRNGKQIFWPYHWIIRKDGKYERLLEDGEIGWHAGNWDINCKSIAIVFDNDYENGTPTDIELNAAKEIIKNGEKSAAAIIDDLKRRLY